MTVCNDIVAENSGNDQNCKIRIWPLFLISAVRSQHGGAARLYFIARSLDKKGTGSIDRKDLYEFTDRLGIDPRQRRRWLKDAFNSGLLRRYKRHFVYCSLAKAALILGVDHIGKPVKVDSQGLVSHGWRSLVWDGYLATLNSRPVSQAQKEKITGVHPRVQRLYQAGGQSTRRYNFATVRGLKPDQIQGSAEVTNRHIFISRRGKIVQRLPDTRVVGFGLVGQCPRGRSRKVQKWINSHRALSLEGQRLSGRIYRLFHEAQEGIYSTLRQMARDNCPPWLQPQELFKLSTVKATANNWEALPSGYRVEAVCF